MDVTIANEAPISGDAAEFAETMWSAFDAATFPGPVLRKGIGLVARRDGNVVGTATGWLSCGVGYVAELIVHDEMRSQGIGGRLLTRFENLALEFGCPRLALRVVQASPAVSFYESRGWSRELVIEDWLGGLTFLQMKKVLAAAPSGATP